MRLSDLVSRLTPTTYTEWALLIFLVTFTSIVLYTCARSRQAEFERARFMPLDEGEVK